METIIERIKGFLTEKGIAEKDLHKLIGMGQRTVSYYLNGERKPNIEFVSRIAEYAPDANLEYLILGRGAMSKDADITKLHNPPYIEFLNENVTVPLYNVEAAANLSMILENNKENVVSYISLPNMPTVDGAVAVRGDSMYPIIKSGDIVVFKWVSSPEYITFGEIYLVSYTWDNDVHVTVKYVKRSETPEYVKLVSYNTHHEPLDVPIASIQSIAIVKVSIRYNTIS